MTRREELRPEIIRLRKQGLMWREIARELGISRSLAFDYYDDPDGSKARARKARYAAPCTECGTMTNPGGKQGKGLCIPCTQAASKVWTPEAIAAAVQRWADEHGGVPPTATDWIAHGEYWPASSTVVATMGWRNAILAAGFDAFGPGKYGRKGEFDDVIAETVRLYRSGLSCKAVGEVQGVSAGAVRVRLINAGETLRTPWETMRKQVAAA